MSRGARDHRGRPLVAVTGCGMVTSLGLGKEQCWSALTAGASGIRPITRFATDGLRTTIAGTVDFLNVAPYSAPALTIAMAKAAAEEAIAESRVARPDAFPGPLFLATPPAEIEWPQRKALWDEMGRSELPGYRRLLAAAREREHREMAALFRFGSVADHLQERLGTRGLPISVSTACASGASAIQLGVEAIRRGETKAALCIGTDSSVQI